MKSLLLLMCFVSVLSSFSQEDSLKRAGTIRLSKKKDTLYVKASANFTVFAPTLGKTGKSYADFVRSTKQMTALQSKDVMEPMPMIEGYEAPFDYTRFFSNAIRISELDRSRGNDTVKIQVDVRDNGKVYFKNLSNLTRINNKVVVFDERKNVYYPADAHNKSMEVLKKIKKWNPAYQVLPVRGKLKGTTVIRPVRQDLHASGIITIIFSPEPLEE